MDSGDQDVAIFWGEVPFSPLHIAIVIKINESIKQNKKSRNRPTPICPTDFIQKRKTIQWRQENHLNKWGWSIRTSMEGEKNLYLSFTSY